YRFLKEVASECFMPVAYAGGVRTSEHIRRLIQTGIEKVVINSMALHHPEFIRQAANDFGSSTIVAAIDVKKNLLAKSKVYDHIKKAVTSEDPIAYAQRLEESGAGEIFINNVDLDGTMKGYHIPLIKSIAQAVSVPVIACGGCKSKDDLRSAIVDGHASAAA